jgi:hypothetical protein
MQLLKVLVPEVPTEQWLVAVRRTWLLIMPLANLLQHALTLIVFKLQ